jgi:hypothetical protein
LGFEIKADKKGKDEEKGEKTTLARFKPAQENPMDFKSIALTNQPEYLFNQNRTKSKFSIYNN